MLGGFVHRIHSLEKHLGFPEMGVMVVALVFVTSMCVMLKGPGWRTQSEQ
jgi:hypothetical protein